MDKKKTSDLYGKISRRKLIATAGLTSAAVISGGVFSTFGKEVLATSENQIQTNTCNADETGYQIAIDQMERTVGTRLREQINVKDFGAEGDGVTDDTQNINNAIDYVSDLGGGTIYIPRGIYMIDGVKANNTAAGGVILKSKVQLVFDKNAIFKAIPNNSPYYSIISIMDCHSVHIIGVNLMGDRQEHTGSTGEWGHGIFLFNASYVAIQAASIKDCWGDGIYLRNSHHVSMTHCLMDNNRRQGTSIISGTNLYFHHCQFINTNGTAPQAGVDIEPNQASEVIRHVTFAHCKFLNNLGRGLVIDIRYGAVCENINVIHSELTGNSSMSIRIVTRNESLIKDVHISNVAVDDIDMGMLGEANIVNVHLDQVNAEQMVFRSVENLLIMRSVLSSEAANGVKALALGNVTKATIRDTSVLNSSERGIGLVSGYNEYITFDNVKVISPAGHGIQATNTSARFVTITNSLVKGAASSGIEGVGLDWIVSNNHIHENGLNGLRLVSTAQRSLVSGNNFIGNGALPIENGGDATNIITNNIEA